ncbi:MAG: hypothetical protein LLF98_02685 [Clostridium sp.]|uniref:hypothetical protein n=1 Tax=Clostridium sp. TaxID=1506 RepID=UPI0025BD23FD|nr:hypothetical protein [Clostridium sp.]MCE5220190.1 hypothetical protein [Clostridium sp.]
MDFSNLKDYYKRTEIENIHWEIFKESGDYKNYLIGVAQGLYSIYDLINTYKDQVNDNEDWLKVIKYAVGQDEQVSEYFDRLSKKKS